MSINLDSKKVYEILKTKDVPRLFHANTVRTSKTFLKNGALLSRKYVEDNDLDQTVQLTDSKDKALNIWDGIFLDMKNLSNVYSRPNKYGPVLFGIKPEVLLDDNYSTVRITKSSPYHWNINGLQENQYFTSEKEFEENYSNGTWYDGGTMLILTPGSGQLDLHQYLDRIAVDDPAWTYNGSTKLIDSIKRYFSDDLIALGHTQEIIIRTRPYLQPIYAWMIQWDGDKFKKLFFPR